MDRPVPPELLGFLAPYPDAVVATVLALRARVLEVVTNAHETAWDATNAVAVGYGPTSRTIDGVVHIAAYSKHANLGFNHGASLADPMDVLVGSGSQVRHVTFRSVADTTAGWIGEYVLAAVDAAGLSADMGDGATTIRVASGPKRRPR